MSELPTSPLQRALEQGLHSALTAPQVTLVAELSPELQLSGRQGRAVARR